MPRDSTVTLNLTKTEALALARIADTGLRVTKALALIQSTVAAETALRKLDEVATRPGK